MKHACNSVKCGCINLDVRNRNAKVPKSFGDVPGAHVEVLVTLGAVPERSLYGLGRRIERLIRSTQQLFDVRDPLESTGIIRVRHIEGLGGVVIVHVGRLDASLRALEVGIPVAEVLVGSGYADAGQGERFVSCRVVVDSNIAPVVGSSEAVVTSGDGLGWSSRLADVRGNLLNARHRAAVMQARLIDSRDREVGGLARLL